MSLDLTYTGADPLASAYIIALEYCKNDDSWQIYSAIPSIGLNYRKPVDFIHTGNGYIAKIDVLAAISPPSGQFTIYVIAHRKPFDHRVCALLDNIDSSREGLVGGGKIAQMVDWAKSGHKAPLVAKTSISVF